MVSDRLRAIWRFHMPEARELAGLHELDGQVQDLSPAGVKSLLASLGQGEPEPDAHDEAHLAAAEAGACAGALRSPGPQVEPVGAPGKSRSRVRRPRVRAPRASVPRPRQLI